jgi:hypothetical protein
MYCWLEKYFSRGDYKKGRSSAREQALTDAK